MESGVQRKASKQELSAPSSPKYGWSQATGELRMADVIYCKDVDRYLG